MDQKILDVAAKAPKLFVDVSVGDGEEYSRDPGFQLTKEQIVSLRKYEVLGLSLPVVVDDVIVYLDYGKGETGGPGLTARDFQVTFKKTYDHARRWSPLREKIMLTGTDLKIFAGSILLTGNAILDIYDDLKVSKYLEEHDIDTPEKYLALKRQIPGLPSLDLPAGDVPEIKLYLDDILTKIQAAYTRARSVRDQLDSFGTDMREEVLPQIQLRLKAVSNNTYQKDIRDLQAQMDERSKEIDALSKEYDQMVQEAIKSAAGLNIGGLILAIYTGIKAEGIRKRGNELKAAQEFDNQKMASKSKTLSSLNRVRADLQSLNDVTVEAEVATQNLMLVWNALTLYVSASKEDADLLKDATSLRRFKNQMRTIVEPWEQIRSSSDQLLRVFAQADKEYEASKVKLKGGISMLMSGDDAEVTEFNIDKLRASNADMQFTNSTAQMLFERYDYAPGAVRTMNGLAISASQATADLRVKSQTTILNFERSQRNLKLFQEEVTVPGDADEVRDDMAIELKRVSSGIVVQSEALRSIRENLKASYNQGESARLIVGLKDERSYAQERKGKLEEQGVELNAEIKSLSEAIDVIAKAGIEKIGQEAELTYDNVKALGLAPPQVQMAMFAIDTVKKVIAGIGETINFLNMLAAQSKLREKALDVKAQVKKQVKDIELANGRIELLETLSKMDEVRWEYVSELSKLLAYFEALSSKLAQRQSVPVEERVALAIAQMTEASKYLKPITM